MVKVWPVVEIKDLLNVRRYEDYSKIFFFTAEAFPFNLRAFAGETIFIRGNLRPDVNNYLKLYSDLLEFAFMSRNQALTTSGASEMHSEEFVAIKLDVQDVDDYLNIAGSGEAWIYVRVLSAKKNLLDWTILRYSPRFEAQDTTEYSGTYMLGGTSACTETRKDIHTIDLGAIKTVYLHSYLGIRNLTTETETRWEIYISDDGTTWTLAASTPLTTATAEVKDILSWRGSTRYLRFTLYLHAITTLTTTGQTFGRIRKVWVIG